MVTLRNHWLSQFQIMQSWFQIRQYAKLCTINNNILMHPPDELNYFNCASRTLNFIYSMACCFSCFSIYPFESEIMIKLKGKGALSK